MGALPLCDPLLREEPGCITCPSTSAHDCRNLRSCELCASTARLVFSLRRTVRACAATHFLYANRLRFWVSLTACR